LASKHLKGVSQSFFTVRYVIKKWSLGVGTLVLNLGPGSLQFGGILTIDWWHRGVLIGGIPAFCLWRLGSLIGGIAVFWRRGILIVDIAAF
jgi:hypothetical protein